MKQPDIFSVQSFHTLSELMTVFRPQKSDCLNVPEKNLKTPANHITSIFSKACETLWSAREMASVALSAEQERRTENVFHMLLR